MNKPSVFLLGVQKSGTTAIAGMLAEHSEIFVPSVKETYFFIDESLNSRGESWYLSEYYSRNSVGNARFLCDATPFYLCSEEAMKRVASFSDPDARFIVCLRDPVKRAYSAYWHQRRLGNETADFKVALDIEADRIAEAKASGGRWWRHAYAEVGLYGKHLELAFSIFGRERILVLNENDLADSALLKSKLHSFIGLTKEFGAPPISRTNKSVMPRSRLMQGLVNGQNPLKRTIRFFLPRQIRSALGKKILKANVKAFDYPPMADDAREFLNKIFADDLVCLRALGVDVPSKWTEQRDL